MTLQGEKVGECQTLSLFKQSPVPPAQLWEHQVQEMRNVSTTYDHVVIT